MHPKIRTLLAIRHGSFRNGYRSLDVLGWRDVELIARAIRETAPQGQIALLHAPGPIATVTARRIGYLTHVPTKMLPSLLGRDGKQRSYSSFRRLCDVLAQEGEQPHVIAVTNGKLLRQFASELGIKPASRERDLEIQRGGMVGVGWHSRARFMLDRTPSPHDYPAMRDTLQAFWAELVVRPENSDRRGV